MMGCRGQVPPSFKVVTLQISVVYPVCIILSLIILNCSRFLSLPETQNCLTITLVNVRATLILMLIFRYYEPDW